MGDGQRGWGWSNFFFFQWIIIIPKIKIRKSGPFYILKHRNYEWMDLMISKNKNPEKV